MKLNFTKAILGCTLFFSAQFVAATNPTQLNVNRNVLARSYALPAKVTTKDYIAGVVIVKIVATQKSNCTPNSIAIPSLQNAFSKLNVTKVRQLFPNALPVQSKLMNGQQAPDLTTLYELHYVSAMSITQAIEELLTSKAIVYAEPSFIYHLSYTPNDPDTLSPKNYYQKIIKAYQAWNISKGDTNTVIGIVDTGGDLDHPDLAANVKYNHADPIDGIDNDNDGYIDNYKGWDMIGASGTNFVPDGDPNVQVGGNDHGVHVGGDASAVADNNTGIAGIGFKCKLLFVKCAPDAYDNAIYSGYEGIVYAVDHGASIINCSWGGAGGGTFGQDVINYAAAKGALVVAAAGNDGIDAAQYPSSYDNVFSVASSTATDKASNFTTYNYSVDVSAPGSGIYSTTYNNSYNSYDGTSMASPITAGAAAIVKSYYPNYIGIQVGEKLRVTADDVYSKSATRYKDKLGKGRINLYRALTETSPSIRIVQKDFIDKNNGAFVIGDTITMNLRLVNYLDPTSNLMATISSTSAAVTLLNTSINLGVMGTLQPLDVAPVKFIVKAGTAENTKVNFKIAYADGSYVDAEFFSVEVNISSLNIVVNQLQSTATGIGRVGYRNGDGTGGLGIVYKGVSMLYEAALMIGQNSTTVSNNARSEATTPDENFVATKRVAKVNKQGFDFYSEGEFNDAAALPSQQLLIAHREMAWSQMPNDKFIIVEYKVKNTTATNLTGMHIGLFLDWDIVNSATNRVLWDSTNKMGVAMSTTAGDPMGAVKLLSHEASANFYGQSYSIPGDPQENGFSIAEKYLTMSSGIVNDSLGFTGTGLDVQYTIAAGPYEIDSAAEATVAFAFIAGDSLADLQASAQAAQAKYNSLSAISSVGANTSLLPSMSLSPNPANQQVVLVLNFVKPCVAKIIFRDQLGRVIQQLNDQHWMAGKTQQTINLAGFKPGIYFVNMQADGANVTQKLVIY